MNTVLQLNADLLTNAGPSFRKFSHLCGFYCSKVLQSVRLVDCKLVVCKALEKEIHANRRAFGKHPLCVCLRLWSFVMIYNVPAASGYSLWHYHYHRLKYLLLVQPEMLQGQRSQVLCSQFILYRHVNVCKILFFPIALHESCPNWNPTSLKVVQLLHQLLGLLFLVFDRITEFCFPVSNEAFYFEGQCAVASFLCRCQGVWLLMNERR